VIPVYEAGEHDGDEGKSPTVATGPTQSSPTSPTSTTAGGTVSQAEARSLVRRSVDVYEAEDADALGRLFSPDIVQMGSGTDNRDRDAVLADFRQRFALLDSPRYRFTEAAATPGAPATVTGTYDVTDASGMQSNGTIAFTLERVDGSPTITRLVTARHSSVA
jgi:ketosteroid isomerase-like protein